MPRRDPNLRLQDIADAIDRIVEYTASHSLESFKADTRTVDAVVRNLEVIGEAARHLDAETASQLPQVPWRELQAMRNVLIHEYFGVSIDIIWETISRDLRSAREAVRQHLDRAPSDQQRE
ncbi:MAG: HepT-like ribonuclease domain-containing protein [Vicinamibacterales bacterium]